ncbi:MAG: hypothetical protein ACLTFB_01330 [Candidatus Phytoplasma pyri]
MFNNNGNNENYKDKRSKKNNKYFILIILLLEILFFSFIYLTNKTNIDNFFCNAYKYLFPNSSHEIISDKEPQNNIIDYKKHYTEEYYTAYHEAGHTLISLYLSSKSNNKIKFIKADIIPENKALGKTVYTYDSSSKPILQVLISLGGVAAELILKDDKKMSFYKVGEGCGSDMESIKKILLKNQYSEFQINQFISIAIKKVKFILNENKKYLEYIADLLFSRKRIIYRDLKHIIPFIRKK